VVDLEIAQLAGIGSGDPLPVVRADWFISTATRPPLYNIMLQLPHSAVDLEKLLKVNVNDNFQRDQLTRAGFAASGVSGQNRMLERHEAAYGAYWKSYDFLPGNAKSNLLQFPLGPEFEGNKFEEVAFSHDGGEIIFHLPNRMQGYFLINAKDRRIDEGPVNVVSDSLKTSGTPAIVTGLSCMACHKHGMIGFKDQVRDGAGVFDAAKLKVRQLYPEPPVMDGLVKEDSELFMRALDKAVGPFLKVGADKDRTIADLTNDEPIGAVARLYRLVDLDLQSVACELDIDNPELLRGMIAGNRRLQEIGLASLSRDGGKIKRADWEKARLRSTYQMAAQEIGKGTPVTRLH
jgi:serine/threonine-protein kinase